jgi:hypothetical protein
MSRVSPRMRIFAFAGLGLVVVLVAFKLLFLSPSNKAQPPLVILHHTGVVHRRSVPVHKTAAKPVNATLSKAKPTKAKAKASKAKHVRPAVPKLNLDPNLPAPLRKALSHSRVVVAVLYAPDIPGDSDAVNEARKGAKAAHVGFTVLNVRNEAVARAVARQVQGASDPAVLVVRRPGTVALKIDGFVDAAAVAQAAANTHP